MRHPTDEELAPLLRAIDIAAWAWNVKKNTPKGRSCPVDWRGAFQDLSEAWHMFQLTTDDSVITEQEAKRG